MPQPTVPDDCPCGSGAPYAACCGPALSGERPAATAEALMRSRYTAYALQEVDYILSTHAPEGAEEVDREGVERWARESTWHGLQIVDRRAGGPDDDDGEVEFIASYDVKGAPAVHHERASFRRVDGRWLYVDGAMVKPKPVVRSAPKVGRNEPCPCGSGKKYKQCHGRS
jgi:SEC-C motif domain protein